MHSADGRHRVTTRTSPGVVTQLRFDHAVTLAVDVTTLLRIEMPFRFFSPGRDPVLLDPEQITTTGVPDALFGVLHAPVEALTYSVNGAFEVVVAGGRRITVQPSTQDEAWTLSGPGNALVVSTLDGAVSVWPDTTGQEPLPG